MPDCFQNRLIWSLAISNLCADFVDYDYGVVDQQAESDNQSRNRHLVDRDFQESHARDHHHCRKRKGDPDDNHASPSHQEKDNKGHRESADQKIHPELFEAILDIDILSKKNIQFDTGRQGFSKRLQHFVELPRPQIDATFFSNKCCCDNSIETVNYGTIGRGILNCLLNVRDFFEAGEPPLFSRNESVSCRRA